MDKAVKTILVLALLSAAGRVRAQEHPVPLEKNVDAATCLQCHEDKSKGQHVHSAIAMGCTACHEVKTEKDTTTITLVAPKKELCFTCHASEAKAEDNKHGPWERGQCVFCHDPHVSDYPNQLRAQSNALCLECHDARKGPIPEKFMLFGSQEATRADLAGLRRLRLDADNTRGHPLGNHWVASVPDFTRPGQKMGCLTCHVPHFSPEDKLARVITEKDKSGKEVKVDACYACHTALDKQAAEERIRMVPQVEKEIRQQQADVQKKREEYLKKLPKLAGDDRDKQ